MINLLKQIIGLKITFPVILTIIIALQTGCIDDSMVSVNTYKISTITTPVNKFGGNPDRKVHIGHDLPVEINLEAEYAEDEIPIQFYLLHMDDVEEVEHGIGEVGDIRMYYIDRTPLTVIDHINDGTGLYQLVINIPANDAIDEMTGDFKTGTFYVVAEVNKDETAEIDAYEVYNKFKGVLDSENIINVTTEYTSKPDLSIEEMNFTGGEEDPGDVLTFLDLVLDNLPGAEQFSLPNIAGIPTIHVTPSKVDRTFMGSIHIKSSSSDALNVPINFWLKNSDGSIEVPLKVYDSDLGGYVYTYYIPLLKANITERATLALLIPKDQDGFYLYPNYDAWPANPTAQDIQDYPVSAIRHDIGPEYKDYDWTVKAVVNQGGSITESRFIVSKTDDYDPLGNNNTLTNNTQEQSMVIRLDKMEVKPNEGIKTYPYDKKTSPVESDRQLVIFWDGFEWNVGGSIFGATASAHEGAFFHNFSLYSVGVDIHATVFKNTYSLVNAYINAASFPSDSFHTGFSIHVEANNTVKFTEAGTGFSENNWNYPITLVSKSFEKEMWYSCFKFKLIAGVDVIFTPGINLNLNSDGSLRVDKYMNLLASVYADASISLAGLAGIGLYTYLDLLLLELIQSTYTVTEFNVQDQIRGYLYRDFGIYLTGPTGYIDLYLEIDFIFFSKRWSWEIFSFSTFRIPLVELALDPNSGAGTTYMDYYNPNE